MDITDKNNFIFETIVSSIKSANFEATWANGVGTANGSESITFNGLIIECDFDAISWNQSNQIQLLELHIDLPDEYETINDISKKDYIQEIYDILMKKQT